MLIKISIALFVFAGLGAGAAHAGAEKLEDLNVHCTTAGTSPDGSGKNCSSSGCVRAPDGFVIVRDSYNVTDNSNNGGWYGVEFSEFVEIIPGTEITGPKKVCINVGANSKAGMVNANVRGWMDVTGHGKISKYKN